MDSGFGVIGVCKARTDIQNLKILSFLDNFCQQSNCTYANIEEFLTQKFHIKIATIDAKVIKGSKAKFFHYGCPILSRGQNIACMQKLFKAVWPIIYYCLCFICLEIIDVGNNQELLNKTVLYQKLLVTR